MKTEKKPHAISAFSSMLLFFVFLLFLLPVLILAAGAYQSSVEGKDINDNLYTASTYLTTKFRQYDGEEGALSLTPFGDGPALCFTSHTGEKTYLTYLYLQEGALRELYTMEGLHPSPQMGMEIAELSGFSIEEPQPEFFLFTLEDPKGHSSRLLLHAGPTPGEVSE